MLLYAVVLTLGLTVAPVMVSTNPFSPVEVKTYTYGSLNEPRVNKMYQLSMADDPSGIPIEDFERGGRRYYLLGVVVDDTDNDVELTGSDLLPLFICVGCAVMAAVMVFCSIIAKQGRYKSFYGKKR